MRPLYSDESGHVCVALKRNRRTRQQGLAVQRHGAAGDAQIEERLEVGREARKRQHRDLQRYLGRERFAHDHAFDGDFSPRRQNRGKLHRHRRGSFGERDVFHGEIELLDGVVVGRRRGQIFECDGEAVDRKLTDLYAGQRGRRRHSGRGGRRGRRRRYEQRK